MPGPPPKHPSVRARRNDPKKDFTMLPAAGRSGAVPKWPLLPDPELLAQRDLAEYQVVNLEAELLDCEDSRTKTRLERELAKVKLTARVTAIRIEQADTQESALWRWCWSTPQAVWWEQTFAHREVAQYVRWKVRAEQGNLAAGAESRQQADRLGLNPLALLRLRLEIEKVDEAETSGTRRRAKPPTPATKPAAKGKKPVDPRAHLTAV
jgi:hypothetical protein